MQETLLLIERLYELDQRRDQTWDAMKGLEKDLAETDARILETQAELAVIDGQREALKTQERAQSRELDKHVQRRDRTREQLDQGAIPDYLTGQRQLDGLIEIIDGIETTMLGLMDERETLDRKHLAIAERGKRLQARRQQQQERLEQEGPRLKSRLDGLNQERKERKESVPAHVLREYEDLRKLHRDALVWLEGGACRACRMLHPPQIVLEVRRGSKVHRCRGCTRFLAGVAEAEPQEEVKDPASRVDG